MAISVVLAMLLLTTTLQATHLGDCFDDLICKGKQVSSLDSNTTARGTLANVKTACSSFRSKIGPPVRAKVCKTLNCGAVCKPLFIDACYEGSARCASTEVRGQMKRNCLQSSDAQVIAPMGSRCMDDIASSCSTLSSHLPMTNIAVHDNVVLTLLP